MMLSVFPRGARMATSFDCDVFVSYSRDEIDRDVTVRLQEELALLGCQELADRLRLG
jgi:hypothetical protein